MYELFIRFNKINSGFSISKNAFLREHPLIRRFR